MSRLNTAQRMCDNCGDAPAYRLQLWCDNCEDNRALELATRDYIRGGESRGDAGDIFEPIESESLRDCLQDIGAGLSAKPWY